MTRYRFAPLAFTAALALAASPAAAQSSEPRWTLNLGLGIGASASGNVHLGGSGLVLGLPTTVSERSYRDIYENQTTFGFDLGYAVSERSEVFGGFTYASVASKSLRVGNVAGLDLNAKFADYKSWGLDAGYRYFLSTGMVRPFVGLRAGLRVIDAIPSDFSVPAAGVTLAATPFYEKSTVPSAGFDAGIRFMAGPRVGIGLQSGLLWRGNLKQLEGLAGTGLENLNDESSRWSIPVLGTFSIRF
jgi:hypothetical protein